jgi:hypothetical protein
VNLTSADLQPRQGKQELPLPVLATTPVYLVVIPNVVEHILFAIIAVLSVALFAVLLDPRMFKQLEGLRSGRCFLLKAKLYEVLYRVGCRH